MSEVTQALAVGRYGVEIKGKPDFEDWCEAFTTLLDDKEKAFWGVGDLLVYAEESGAYGEDYAAVLDGKRLSHRGMINRMSICRRFPIHDRNWNVSGSHYEVVRALPNDQAFALLEEAEAMDMTREDLRERVREVMQAPKPETFDAEIVWDADRRVFVPTVDPPTWIVQGELFKTKLRKAAA